MRLRIRIGLSQTFLSFSGLFHPYRPSHILAALILLTTTALALTLLTSPANAVTEFVSTIAESGGDYTSLTTWEANNQADLVSNTAGVMTRVLSHGGITGAVDDGDFVKGATSAAYGTVTHATTSQICVKAVTGTFVSGETINVTDTLNGAVSTGEAAGSVAASTAPDSVIAVARIDGAWTNASGYSENTAVTIDGWTTNASYYIKIYTTPAARHTGKWKTDAYILGVTAGADDSPALYIKENFVTVEGLQIKYTNSGGYTGNGCAGIRIDGQDAAATILIQKNIIQGAITNADSAGIGIYGDNANITGKIYNNAVYNFKNAAVAGSAGIATATGGTYNLYNNTVYNNLTGISIGAGAITAKNNIANGNTTDYSGTIATHATNLSQDATSPDGASYQGANGTALFVSTTPGSEDFHLQSTDTAAKNRGTSTGAPTDDIEGIIRSGTWDIGASEYGIVWLGTTSTNWETAANWSGGVKPGANDTAIFNATSGAYDCALGANITSLGGISIVNGYTGALSNGAYTLTVTNFSQSGGTFTGGTANMTLNGNFTLSGGTFTAPSGTLTCAGDFTITGGSFSEGSGTVSFTGLSKNFNANGQTFNNFTFNKNNSGQALTIDSGNTITVNGTLNLTVGNSYGGTIIAKGNVTQGANFGYGTGTTTIRLEGTDAQSYTISGGKSPKVVFNNSNINFTQAVDCTFGSLTLTAGTYNCSSFTTTIANGTDLAEALKINGGTFNVDTGTVVFSGVNYTINMDGKQFNNVTLKSNNSGQGAYVTAGTSIIVNGTLTLYSGFLGSGTINATGSIVDTASWGDSGGTGGAGSITVSGTNDQTIAMSTNKFPTGTFTVNKASNTVTTSGALTIPGAVTISGGTLTLGGNTTFQNDVTINSGGALSAVLGGGTILFKNSKTVTVNSGGELTLYGTPGGLLTLNSDNTTKWRINAAAGSAYNIDFVNAKYSDASTGGYPTIHAGPNTTIDATDLNWDINTLPGVCTWVGGAAGHETDWATAANWSPAALPGAASNCIIPDTANDPVISPGTTPAILTLTINSGAQLTANDNLAVTAGVDNNGTLVMAAGKTLTTAGIDTSAGVFTKAASSVIKLGDTPGSGIIKGGSNNLGILDIEGAATVSISDNVICDTVNVGQTVSGSVLSFTQGTAASLTATGDITVYSGSTITCPYTDLTTTTTDSQGATVAGGKGRTITAANIDIQSGGTITADACGFPAAYTSAPGYGTNYPSHGGASALVTDSPSPYGSAANPESLGSGNNSYAGGGAIKLSVTGTVTVNGTLSASGPSSTGGGAGGSINITASALEGSGAITAKAGYVYGLYSQGGGGGGRISLVNVGSMSNFSGSLNVNGSLAGYSQSYAGTIAFPSNYNLTLPNGNMSTLRLGYDGTYNYDFGAITINSGGTLELDGNPLVVAGGSVSSPWGTAATVSASSVTVASGGTIKADGLGFSGDQGPGKGPNWYSSCSHGGEGGDGEALATYGSIINPVNLGSGGHFSGYAGGGAVILSVAGTCTIDGAISASPTGPQSSSAGSVNITCGSLAGTGTISAKGNASGGGGGRISVIQTTGTSWTPTFQAFGGSGSPKGAAGTIYLQDANDGAGNGEIIIDNNNMETAAGIDTLISSSVTDTAIGNVTVQNDGKLQMAADTTLTCSGTWNNTSAPATGGASAALTAGTVVFDGTGTVTTGTSNNFYYVSLAATGALTLADAMGVTHDWTGASGGTVSSGTVNLAGTGQKILGSTAFYSLTKSVAAADTLYFDNTGTQTFAEGGTLTLAGAADQLLSLRSCDAEGTASDGTYWHINPSGARSVSYVDYKDSYNDNATVIAPATSTDSLHNVNWSSATYTWSGATNTDWATATNWQGGVAPTDTGCTVIIPDVTNNPIIAASSNISIGAITVQTGGNLTIASGATLTVSGNLTNAGTVTESASGTTNLTVIGKITNTGTLAPNNNTITCSGDFDTSAGTFTYLTSTLNMNAATGSKTVTLNSTAKACYNLTFSGAGEFSFGNTDVNVKGSWTQSAGTVTAPSGTLTFSNNYTHTAGGTFNHNNGKVKFTGQQKSADVDVAEEFYDFELAYNWAQPFFLSSDDTFVVNHVLTMTEGAFSGTIEAKGTVLFASSFYGSVGYEGNLLIDGAGDQSFTIPDGAQLPNLILNSALTTIDFASGANVSFVSLTIQQGTFTSTSGILTFPRSTCFFTHTGGTFGHNNGTIKLTGQTKSLSTSFEEQLYNLEVAFTAGGYYVTIPSETIIDIENSLLLTDGAVYGGTLQAKGPVVVASTFDGGTTAIQLTSTTADQALTIADGGKMPSGLLTIDKSGYTTTISGTTSAAKPLNNITVTAGTLTFNPGTYYIDDADTVTVASGATLNFAGTDAANMVVLRSDAASAWDLTGAGTVNAAYTDVQYSNAASRATVAATTSADSGSNANWTFTNCNTWIADSAANWNDTSAWSTGAVPGADENVYFGSAHTGGCAFNASVSAPASINVASGYTGTFTGNNGITVSVPVSLDADTTVFVDTGATFTISGVISGAAALNKTGAGTLTLSGANTFSGGLTIKAGTVVGKTNNSCFGGGSITLGDTTGSNSATLSSYTNPLVIANPIILATNASIPALTITNGYGSSKATFTGGVTGENDLVVNWTTNSPSYSLEFSTADINNNGTITLNTTNGNLTVSSSVGSNVTGISLGTSGVGNIVSSASINPTGTITNSGTGTGTAGISGVIGSAVTGVIQNSSTSTLTLYGNNTFSGGVTIKAGKVVLSTSANAAGTGTITIGNTGGSDDAILEVGESKTIANPITVASGSSGTLSISGYNWEPVFSGAITLNNNLTLNTGASFGVGDDLELRGQISGEGNIILNNNSAGTITLANAAGGINHTGAITNSGTGTGATTISAVIGSNVTGITQNSGTSALTLSGNNSTVGDVTITSGTLSLSGTTNLNVTGDWSNSGTFTPNTSTVTFTGTNNSITGSNNFYNLTKLDSANDSTDETLTFDNTATQTVSGALTVTGTDTDDRVNLVSDSPGTQWSVKALGTHSVSWADVADSDASDGLMIYASDSTDSLNNINWSFSALTYRYWIADTEKNWSDTTAWSDGNVPDASGEVAVFNSTHLGNCVINNSYTNISAINVMSGYTGILKGNNGITVSKPISLGANTTVDVASGTFTISGVISGSGNLAKTGAGTLALTGVNTFNNGLWVKAGTVQTSNTGDATSFGAGTITLGDSSGDASATVNFNYNKTYTNPITVGPAGNTLSTSAVLTISDTNWSPTLTGAITLNHDLVFYGNNTGGFNGNISGTGNITIQNNTYAVFLGNSSTSINNIGTITNNGAGPATTTISGIIGSNVTGVIQNSSTSALTLSQNNTFSGGVTIKAGKVALRSNSNAAGTGTITLGDTSGSENATLDIKAGYTWGNAVSVASGSSGTLTLTMGNDTTGSATMNNTITLNNNLIVSQVANGAAMVLSGAITGTGNLTLNADNTGAITLSNTAGGGINNTGTITNSGSSSGTTTISGVIGSSVTGITQNSSTSKLTLSGNNSTVGGVTITLGTLELSASKNLNVSGDWSNSGTFTAGSGSTVTFTGTNNAVSGSTTFADVTKTTAGILTFNPGTYTFTAAKTLTIGDGVTCDFNGADGNLVTLRSGTPGSYWNLNNTAGTVTADYVDVQDSDAVNTITATNSTDSGHNDHWTITGNLTATSVTPHTLVCGAADYVDVVFTNQTDIPSGGKVSVTFPSGFSFNPDSATTASSPDSSISVNSATSAADQAITITTSALAAADSAHTIRLTNVKNPNATGLTGTYSIATKTSADVAIDSVSGVTGSTIVNGGALTSTNVTPPANYVAGDSGASAIAFTTANPLPDDGVVEVTFPAGFIVGSPAIANVSGMDGTYAVTKSGQAVTVTRQGDGAQVAASAAISFTLSDITNPSSAGSTGTYTIKTASASGTTDGRIDQDTAVTADTILLWTANLAVGSSTATTATLTWTAVGDPANFDHYEIWYDTASGISGASPELEWDNSDDAALATYSTTSTNITGLTAGATYYFKAWAIYSYGGMPYSSEISQLLNTQPIGGYSAAAGDNVIPAAQCAQSAYGSGIVTITFRIKDADANNCTLSTFQYSTNGGDTWSAPANGDTSACLSIGWKTNTITGYYASAVDWSGAQYQITFNTKHADVTGLSSSYNNDVRIRFTVNDGINDSVSPAASENFVVDNVNPTSLAGLTVASTTATSATLTWTKAADDTTANFNYYLYYGTESAAVAGRTATLWNYLSDSTLGGEINTQTTTITGLSGGTTYYFMIWAKDKYGNQMQNPDTTPISAATTGLLSSVSVTPSSNKTGASADYTIAFTTQNVIPEGGKIDITFDDDYTFEETPSVSGTPTPAITGVFKTGQTLRLTTGAAVAAGGSVSVTLSGIINPKVTQTVTAPSIYTKDANLSNLDYGSDTDTDHRTIAVNDLQGTSTVTAADTTAGATDNYTIAFTTFNPVASGGKAVIAFDSDYDLTGTLAVESGSTHTAAVAGSGSDLTVTFTQDVAALASVSMVISGIKNPTFVQTTDTLAIYTKNSADSNIDYGAAAGTTIAVGSLTGTSTVTSPAYAAGDSSRNYTIAFTATNPIQSGGKVYVTFDSDYDLSGAAYVSGNAGSTVDYSSNVLMVTLGAAVNANTAVTLVISGIKNPVWVQDTSGGSIYTKRASGANIDTGTYAGQTITHGSLTGTPSVSSPTYVAGDATQNYTIAFTTANPIPQGGRVKVTFDSDYNLSGAAYVSGNDDTTASYSSNVLTLTLGTAVNAAEAVSLAVSGIRNPRVTQTTSDYQIETQRSSSDSYAVIDAAAVSGHTITAGNLTAGSVTGASYAAGAVTSYTITFTTPNPVPALGRVRVTFDSDYNLTGALAVVSGNDGATADDSSNVLIITTGTEIAAGSSPSIVVSGIKNPLVTQTTADYILETRDTDGTSTIDQGSASGHTITTGALSEIEVLSSGGTYPAGDSSQNYLINFRTANPIASNGHIRLTFDTDYDVSGASYNNYPTSSVTASIESKAGGVILLQLAHSSDIAAGEIVSLSIAGIKNPDVTQTTSAYQMQTENAANTAIDYGTYPGHAIAVGVLSSPSVTPASLKAGAVTSDTIAFTTPSRIEADGDVVVVFPSGFNLSAVTAGGAVSGNTGATVASVSGQTLTINVGTTIEAASSPSLAAADIKNPTVSGTTGAFTITTKDSSGNAIGESAADGVAITTGEMTSLSASALSYTATESTTYTFDFTAVNAVAAGGGVKITFDADYVLTGTLARVTGSSHTGTVAKVDGENAVLFTLTQQITAANPAVTLMISGIVNPALNQTTADFAVQTQNSSGTAIDAGSAAGVDIAGVLADENVTAATYVAGSSAANYTISFVNATEIPSGGAIETTFDADYDISGAALGTNNVSGSITAKSNTDHILKIEAGAAVTLGTSVSIVVSGIKNPAYTQTTDNYTIRTRTSGGVIIDSGSAAGHDITEGALTGTVSVTSPTYAAGDNSQNYTVRFTTANPIPQGGSVRVTFDSDYDLTGVAAAVAEGSTDTTATVAKESGANNVIITVNAVEGIAAGVDTSLIISGIKNPTYVQTTDAFNIYTRRTATATNIDQKLNVTGASITAGALTGTVSVTPASYLAGATTNYTALFTTANAVPSGGSIRVTFDSDYDLTGLSSSRSVESGSSHTATVVASGSDLIFTMTEDIDAGDSVTMIAAGVKNPLFVQTTDAFSIYTRRPSSEDNAVIDQDTNVAGASITANALTVGAVTADDYKAGAAATYTFPVTLTNALASGDKIAIALDSDYTVPGSMTVGGDASGSAVFASNTVTITLDAGLAAGSSKSVTVSGIKNPTYVQTTDAFTITTKAGAHSDANIDTGVSAAGASITANALTVGAVTADDYKAGAAATYTFPVTLTNALASGDKIAIALDSDYTVPGSMTVGGDASGSAVFASNTVTITLDAGLAAGSSKSVTVSGIKNPTYVQTTDAFTVTTKKNVALTPTMDSGSSSAGVSITVNALTGLSVNTVSGTYKAGVTEDYTIAFTAVNPIPVGGRIRVTFDADYNLAGTLAVVSGNTDATAAADANILIITAGTEIPAGAVSIVVSGIRNPVLDQTTDTYSVTTKYSDTAPGSDIDTGTTAAGHDITRYLTVTSPASGANWGVADPTKAITWDSGGDINKVNIYYSTTGAFAGEEVAIVTNLTPVKTGGGAYSASDPCSYTWTGVSNAGIPDLVVAANQDPQVNPSVECYIKVVDAVEGHGSAPSDVSDSFNVRYYTITWNVKDMVSMSFLSDLSVNETNSSAVNTWSIVDKSLVAPRTRNYKYDTYTTTWSRDNYFPTSETNWVADSSKAIQLLMETTITKQWNVHTQYTYDSVGDVLNISAWIDKEGILMTGPTSATITIYNSSGASVAVLGQDAGSGEDLFGNTVAPSNGAFFLGVPGSYLNSGQVYFAKVEIVYGGTTYTSGQGLSITIDKNLATISASTSAIETATTVTLPATLSVIETATTGVSGKVDTVSSKIDTVSSKVDTTATKVDTVASQVSTVATKVDTVNTNVAAILTDTSTTLPAEISARTTAVAERGTLSGILNRNQTIREDDTIKIRYRTAAGLAPTLTIYDANGTALSSYSGVTMTEIASTGIYEYSVTCSSSWGTGDFTVVCEEPTKNSKDSMTLTVKALYVAGGGVEEGIDALGEAVTKVYTRSGTIQSLLGTASDKKTDKTVLGMINNINGMNLETVATDARNAKTNAVRAFTEINTMKSQVNDIQAQAKTLNKLSAYLDEMRANIKNIQTNMNKLPSGAVLPAELIQPYQAKLAEKEAGPTKSDIRELNNKVEELTAMVKLMRTLMETSSNKPVVEGWFETE